MLKGGVSGPHARAATAPSSATAPTLAGAPGPDGVALPHAAANAAALGHSHRITRVFMRASFVCADKANLGAARA
jgi:hypothetical protein